MERGCCHVPYPERRPGRGDGERPGCPLPGRGVLPLLRVQGGALPSEGELVLPAQPEIFGPVDLPAQPEKDRHRDPPRGADRPGAVHRPRHGGGHRRDHPDRRQLHPVPGGHPGGHRQGYGQAPPHPGGQRAHRRGGQGAGALHRGGQRPGGRRGRGAGRRSGRGHRRGRARPGGAHQRGEGARKSAPPPLRRHGPDPRGGPGLYGAVPPAGGDGAPGKALARVGRSRARRGPFRNVRGYPGDEKDGTATTH